LKALSNDVRVNLEIPLAGIADLARADLALAGFRSDDATKSARLFPVALERMVGAG